MSRLEFESAGELENYLKRSSDLRGAVFQSMDLSPVAEKLSGAWLEGAILLGCRIPSRLYQKLAMGGATIFPRASAVPYNSYRGNLYSPKELLGDYEIGNEASYAQTLDGKIYAHYLKTGKSANDIVETLGRRLHDHAMTDAVHELIDGRKVVAIMGGHSMPRSDPMYLKVCRIARDLTLAGYLLTSGGGPGAMEATHVGAWFAQRPDEELEDAVSILAQAPLYKPMGPWLDAAFTVANKYPLSSDTKCESLGIPTFLYGHEPPTYFATKIAKYFANSVREEGLLAIAKHGVIFAPGSAGTIQEIFQDAAQNHYSSFDHPSPMILMGDTYWRVTKPVFPLLHHLAQDHEYGKLLTITDSKEEVVNTIKAFSSA